MLIKILPSKYCEINYTEKNEITDFFRNIEYAFSSVKASPVFNILEVLLLLAPKSELQKGKFKEITVLHWEYGIATIGVNGDYERYLNGDDMIKINEIYNMLCKVCDQLQKKKEEKFDVVAMKNALYQVHHNYLQDRKKGEC